MIFRLPKGTQMTPELLAEYIGKHKGIVNNRYQKLIDAYENKYEIYNLPKKPKWKPDNRISANFAKYIVDTMDGFFIGNPIKIGSKDSKVNEYINFLNSYNDQDDNNAELSKTSSIYGRGYEMYYVDDNDQIGITYLSPLEGFIIYDESIVEKPLFFVRYYRDYENVERGSWSDATTIQYFENRGSYRWVGESRLHGFDGVPAVEFVDNAERMGIFESALPMIDAYNKALSEKANDVDYFADAYLKILGERVDNADLNQIRNNRIINFDKDPDTDLIVEFMEKPSADTAQENLINRLERLIYQLSMVANINDENFAVSSGIALKYKLQSMQNLAKTKERKFTSGMNRRYRLIFSNPLSGMKKDDWVGIEYHFNFNFPSNLLEEAQIASALSGVVSKETQLKVLSIIKDAKKEIEKMKEEEKSEESAILNNYIFKEAENE